MGAPSIARGSGVASRKYLFGDGSYSQNILTPYANGTGSIFGTLPGGGGAASCFNGTVDNYGSAATVVENAGAGYNGTWYGVGKTFTDPVKFTQAQIKSPANGGFLSTSGIASSVRLQITEDGTNWYTFWSRTNSGGGVAEVITVDMTSSPNVKGIKAEVLSNGVNGIWIAELALTGSATLQPQASYTAVLGNIAATGSFSYTGTQWNGGQYPATQIFNGVTNDWGILDAVANSSFNWDFGRPVEMQKVRILLYGGAANAHDIYAEYSDNGTVWSVGNHVGYVAQDTVFHDYALGSSVGAHRYWRLRNAATVIFELSEVQWIEQVQLSNCIVVTGAATVAPDPTTGASVFSAQNVLIDGGTLAPSTNCKGLIGFVSGSVRVLNGGRIHIDKLGKAGKFGNLTVLDLVPDSLKRKLKPSLAAFVVQGEGAAGVAASTGALQVKVGAAAGAMQTGSGGEGRTGYGASAAQGYTTGKGGPCCGGAGTAADCYTSSGVLAAGALAAGPYGGPGGKTGTTKQYTSGSTGGGAGDPVGAGSTDGNPGAGAGGGLLMLLTPVLSIASGCCVSADGAAGGAASNLGGGGAGGGCVVIVTPAGGYANAGTVRASGGAGGAATYAGGAGGVGSVNILTV